MLVRTYALTEGQAAPIVVDAAQTALNPIEWARSQRAWLDALLRCHGAILFRNFPLPTPQAFESFAQAIEPELFGEYGDLPRKRGGQKTYESTPYPPHEKILFHNESSHLARWPRKQWFYCEQPAKEGGATPIVDCRRMLRQLPRGLTAEFEKKGLLYVRTFVNRLDVSWRNFFGAESREAVECQLARSGVGWRWLDHDELQTRFHCAAIIRHPMTGERVFFNQVQLHHVSCLDEALREDLQGVLGLERLPRQVYYGDGSPISDSEMQIIGRTYEECAVRFEWQRGDVLMLDNMLTAHGRDPYKGARRIVVAMGEMLDRASIENAAGSVSKRRLSGGEL
jgi:alpha-ketoglutarate-dependent taurine dioxygenase